MSYKILDLKFEQNGVRLTINPVVIYDENEMVLVDCGHPDALPKLETLLKKEGLDMANLTKVIITHHDHDHMGALASIVHKYPNVKVMASHIDSPHIEGKSKSLRIVQAEAIYDALPEEQKEGAKQFQNYLESIEPTKVDIRLKDGDRFDCCGGYEIISTPGHMPGHISVYLMDSKTLIAGDALVVQKGELEIANPQYSLDIKGTKATAKKLAYMAIDRVICYHGGLYEGDVKKALTKMSR
jgi:glyoxylase-like metal-dependent hydrolase (beta-lactamase superfamily II)